MHRHKCFGFFQELRSPAYLWWWLQAWVSLSNETSKSSEIPLDVSLQHRLGQSQALSLHQVHFQDPPVQASLIWHAHWFWLSPANSFTGLITPSHILNFSRYPMSPFSSFFLFLQQRSQAQTGQTNATAVHPQSPELLAAGQGAQPLRSQASNGEMENQTSNGCANWPRAGCFREEGVGSMVSLVLPHLGQCPSSKIDSGKIRKEP